MNDPRDRRSLLWNVLEPGDPYDISKSLIARMPGDTKRFMGDNLEIVCLLQAAEIQRLLEYLDHYKQRYKQVERTDLDRHSYEVQIKELTQMCADSEGLRAQTVKLKEFIRRQSQQLQSASKHNVRVDETLQGKYEEALNQIQVLIKDNQETRTQLDRWKSRCQSLDRARLKQMEESKLESQKKAVYQRQIKEQGNKFQLQRGRFEDLIKELSAELQSKDALSREWEQRFLESERSMDQAHRIIEEYQVRQSEQRLQIEDLTIQLQRQTDWRDQRIRNQGRSRQGSHLNLHQSIAEPQRGVHKTRQQKKPQGIRPTSEQMEQIRYSQQEVVRQAGQYQEPQQTIQKYKVQINWLNNSVRELQIRLNEMSLMENKFEESENKVGMLSQEIARLEYLGNHRLQDINELTIRNKKLEHQYDSLRLDYTEMASRLAETGRQSKSIGELERLVHTLTEENAHLEKISRKLDEQLVRAHNELTEGRRQIVVFSEQNNIYKKRISELTATMERSARSESSAIEFERRVKILEGERDAAISRYHQQTTTIRDLQTTISHLSHERSNALESNQLVYQQQIRQLQGALDKQRGRSSLEVSRYQQMKASHEEQVREVAYERDQLNTIAHELQDRLRLLGGQERIVRYNQEIEKLNARLRDQDQELENFQRKVRSLDIYRQKYQSSSQQIQTLRSRLQLLQPVQNKEQDFMIASLNKEVDSLKKQLQSQDYRPKTVEYEKRLTVFSEEIDRLNQKLVHSSNEVDQLKDLYERTVDEKQELNSIAHDLQVRYKSLLSESKQVEGIFKRDYQAKLALLNSQIGRYDNQIARLGSENSSLKELAANYSAKNQKSNNETYKLKTQNEGYRRNAEMEMAALGENQRKLNTLSLQINRLNSVLKSKVDECDTLRSDSHEILAREGERSKLQLESNSQKLRIATDQNRRLVTQIASLEEQLRSTTVGLHSLKSENDGLRRRIHELQSVGRKNQDLEMEYGNITRQLQQRNSQCSSLGERLRAAASDYQRVAAQLMDKERVTVTEVTRVTTQLHQKVSILGNDNQQLKKQVQQLLKTNSQLQLTSQKLNNQIDLLNVRVRQIDECNSREHRLKADIQKLGQKVSYKDLQIDDLQRNLNQLELARQQSIISEGEMDRLKARNTELSAKLISSQQMAFHLSSQIDSLTQKVQHSEEKVKRLLEVESREKDSSINRLSLEINDYRQKLTKINNEYNIKITQQENEYMSTRQQLNRLSNQLIQAKDRALGFAEQNSRLKTQIAEDTFKLQAQYHTQMSIYQKNISTQQNVISQLKNENGNLRIQLQGHDRQALQLQRLNRTNVQLQSETRQLKSLLSNLNIEREQQQSRLLAVGTQIERLNFILKGKLNVITEGERRIQHALLQIDGHRKEISQLRTQNQGLQKNIDESRKKLDSQMHSSRQAYSGKVAGLQNKISEFKDQVDFLNNELVKLNQKLRVQVGDNRVQMQEIERLDLSLRTRIEAESKVTTYLQQIQRLNNALRIKVQQSQELREKYVSLETDSKMATYLQQIQRLNGIMRAKINESNDYKQKLVSLSRQNEATRQKYNQLLRQSEVNRRKFAENQQRFPKLNAEFENLSRALQDMKRQNNNLRQEIWTQKVQINSGSAEATEDKNKMLALEIERLTKMVKVLQTDIAQLRLRYVDDNALEKRIKEHLGLFVVLFAQIESLRVRVKDKEKECEQVRRSSLAPYIVVPPS